MNQIVAARPRHRRDASSIAWRCGLSPLHPTHWLICAQVGGIVVHNNWQYTSARAAVVDFRRDRGLEHLPLHLVDGNAMAWIKEA